MHLKKRKNIIKSLQKKHRIHHFKRKSCPWG